MVLEQLNRRIDREFGYHLAPSPSREDKPRTMTPKPSTSRPTPRLAALWLSSLSLALGACYDSPEIEYLDSSGSGSAASGPGTLSSYVPSLSTGQATDDSGRGGVSTGDILWPTSSALESTSSASPELTSSSLPSNRSSGATTKSGVETSSASPTTRGVRTGSSSIEGTTGSTGSTGSTGDTSTGSSDSSNRTDSSDSTGSTETDETTGSDHAPRFGLSLSIQFEGETPSGLAHPRVLIAQVQIKNTSSEPGAAQSGPEFAVDRVVYDYPLIGKAAGSRPRVVLPTPPPQDIDTTLQRSPFYMIALYGDANQDKRWNQEEGFIGASPSLFFYQPASENNAERWMRWSQLETYAQLMSTPVQELIDSRARVGIDEQEAGALRLRGFSKMDSKTVLKGQKIGSKLSHNTSFLTAITRQELQDLPTHFIEGPRPVDLDLRAPNSGETSSWNLRLQDLNAMDPETHARFIQEGFALTVPPGLAPQEFVALPLVGYARPVGAALVEPGQFLTRDSQLTYSVCRMRGPSYAALIWLNPGQANVGSGTEASTQRSWITRPIGALYAAWMGLGPGWGLGLTTAAIVDPMRLISTQSETSLYINDTCAAAFLPKETDTAL